MGRIQLVQPRFELLTGQRLEANLELQAGKVAVLVAERSSIGAK